MNTELIILACMGLGLQNGTPRPRENAKRKVQNAKCKISHQ